MRSIALITALLASPMAWAADCATPYTTEGLIEDLTGVETAMREYDDAAAAAAGGKLRAGLGCLDEVLPAMIAARAYRAVGAGLYAAGEPEPANKWFRTSLELEPTWTYGLQDIPEGHPLRNDFESLKLKMTGDEPTLLEGKDFVEGSHYLDGRKISKPKARVDRFHVYQLDDNGVASHVIEGNDFPAEVLSAAAVADGGGEKDGEKDKTKDKDKSKDKSGTSLSDKQLAKAEKAREKEAAKKQKSASKVKTTVAADGTVYYKRQRPKEKTPLMIAGGVVMAGALGLYYGSTRTAAKMQGITTAADVNPGLDLTQPFKTCRDGQELGDGGCVRDPGAEIDRLAGVTNRLVVASVAVFAIGAGTTTWGIILDGGTAMPTVNIRF
ncbi:MAG: hypothetical protein R3F61_16870 [Myxococcota bacterium]